MAHDIQRSAESATPQDIKPDICVIGAGAGAIAAASAAAAFGVNVVLVRNGKDGGGGDGGVPARNALIAAAERVHAARNGAGFGAKTARFGVDFAAVRAHMRDVGAAAAILESRERLTGLGLRLIDGAARFIDRDTVAVDGFRIKARRFVIATGSTPAVPALPGIAGMPYFTPDTVLDLGECPRHLIVVGAGSAGLELAQAFGRLGAKVTVLDAATPLAHHDAECAAIVLDALAREGIALHAGVRIAQLRRALARVQVDIAGTAGETTIEGSHLLIAAGRRANVEGLALDSAGIRYGENGIAVDGGLRTSNRRVYAIGDVTEGARSRQLAVHQAGLVVRHALFRVPVNADRHAAPRVTHTDPPLAQVGFTEDEARAHSGVIRVLRAPYRDNDRALAAAATKGHIKIVTDRQGDILGVAIVGAEAAENIAAWTLAINQKLNIEAFAGVIVPYPAYAEVGKRAAMTYFVRGLTAPSVRRMIGWLRRFG